MLQSGPFRYFPDVERFFAVNHTKIIFYLGRRCYKDRTHIGDTYQYLYSQTYRYKTLEKFDPRISSFHTYWARHLNNQVSSYYRAHELSTNVKEYVDDNNPEEDTAYKSFEIRKDFVGWMHEIKYRNRRHYQIIKLSMTGHSRRYIASRYGLSEARISQILASLKEHYKSYLIG